MNFSNGSNNIVGFCMGISTIDIDIYQIHFYMLKYITKTISKWYMGKS